jgi:hypothetical protein
VDETRYDEQQDSATIEQYTEKMADMLAQMSITTEELSAVLLLCGIIAPGESITLAKGAAILASLMQGSGAPAQRRIGSASVGCSRKRPCYSPVTP